MSENQTPPTEKAFQTVARWQKNIVEFVRENFLVEPDAWQVQALQLFQSDSPDSQRIALRACAGPGKSAILAWCGWWFLMCKGERGEHPKGLAVSCTDDNLQDNLWVEFSKWQQRSPLLLHLFTWTATSIYAKSHPDTWFISARSWPKTADAEAQGRVLSGHHSEFVLYLIDESGDIPVSVLKAAEQGLSNCKWGKILQAGNPTSMQGMLYAAATIQATRWKTVKITGDPDDPDRSPRISLEWARMMIDPPDGFGRADPWVMAYVLGQFPLQSINALIGPDEVEKAMKKCIDESEYSFSEKRIGVDCARFGDDLDVIARRQGLCAMPAVSARGLRSEEIAARTAQVSSDWAGCDQIFIDSTGGYGAGPEDALRLAGYQPIPVNFSGSAADPKYFNKRSEMLCEFSEWVKRGGKLPDSPQLKKELTALTYTFQNGKKRVVEKEQIKKLIKCSPDECDAFALTFAIPDRPRGTGRIRPLELYKPRRHASGYIGA